MAMMGPPGVRRMKRSGKSCAFCSSCSVVSSVIVLSTEIDHQSTDALKRGIGWKTIPTLNCFAVSGPRVGLPPVIVSGVMFSHGDPGVGFTIRLGQVNGSTRLAPLAEGEVVVPLKI